MFPTPHHRASALNSGVAFLSSRCCHCHAAAAAAATAQRWRDWGDLRGGEGAGGAYTPVRLTHQSPGVGSMEPSGGASLAASGRVDAVPGTQCGSQEAMENEQHMA